MYDVENRILKFFLCLENCVRMIRINREWLDAEDIVHFARIDETKLSAWTKHTSRRHSIEWNFLLMNKEGFMNLRMTLNLCSCYLNS